MKDREKAKRNILFISHEMDYTGAPRSLLRMCRVALRLRTLIRCFKEHDWEYTMRMYTHRRAK